MYLSIEIRCHISSLIANPKSGIPNRTHRTHTESSKMEIDTCWALNNLQLGHHHWLTFVFGQPPFFLLILQKGVLILYLGEVWSSRFT